MQTDTTNARVLLLNLKLPPFEVMASGEKGEEYRKPSDWIMSRLVDKNGNDREYEYILYRHAYDAKNPYFLCEYEGFHIAEDAINRTYSNGLEVKAPPGTVVIRNGNIIELGNYKL